MKHKKQLYVTLWRYITVSYLVNFAYMALVLVGLILFFDTIELLRRAEKFDGVPLIRILQMSFLKFPDIAQTIAPFIILFTALLAFWQFNKRHEITIFRAAGFSVWQFTGPVLIVSFIIGVFITTVINPVGTVLVRKFQVLEQTYLSADENRIAVFENGLWLRQSSEEGYIIMHADKLSLPSWGLQNVMALSFDEDNSFLWRIDAPRAALKEGKWLFEDAVLTRRRAMEQKNLSIEIPTTLTSRKIEESFAAPETMPFWLLPRYIRTIESTGFDASSLKVHFQSLIAQPFMFAALILVAACVTLRPPRSQSVFMMIVLGIAAGFGIFFISNFLQALGASQQISIPLAAWAPIVITALFGGGVILSLEDG